MLFYQLYSCGSNYLNISPLGNSYSLLITVKVIFEYFGPGGSSAGTVKLISMKNSLKAFCQVKLTTSYRVSPEPSIFKVELVTLVKKLVENGMKNAPGSDSVIETI